MPVEFSTEGAGTRQTPPEIPNSESGCSQYLLPLLGILFIIGGTVSLLLAFVRHAIARGILTAIGVLTLSIQRDGSTQIPWALNLLLPGIIAMRAHRGSRTFGYNRSSMLLWIGLVLILAGVLNNLVGRFSGWNVLGFLQLMAGVFVLAYRVAPSPPSTTRPREVPGKRMLLKRAAPRISPRPRVESASSWRTVRVFISSTFRDMQAERDHLVRFVFPRLRQELLGRRIHLVDVDLRWGITSEQDALEVCRDIIDECRPRFIAILGERYGWVPPGMEQSITAQEIHYAVLDRLNVKEYRYFYFRDPQATASIPEMDSRSGGYREFASQQDIARGVRDQAEASARQRTGRLEAVKQAIVDAGFQPFVYPARWDPAQKRLHGLEEFGERVYADLLKSIRDEFGAAPAEEPDEFSEEYAAMEAFAAERVERYVIGSRQSILDEMMAFAEGWGKPGILVIKGQPGSGKSALAGRFYRTYVEKHPNEAVILHFVGASAGSTDLRRMLRRLCHELSQAIGAQPELPQDVKELKALFPMLLVKASKSHRVILLIDALNQLGPEDNAHSMSWLPDDLPPDVRVIVSSLEHRTLEMLRFRSADTREIELQPLTSDDGRAVVGEFLQRYHKRLSKEQIEALLQKPASSSPLYLLAALEELRTLGSYEEITQRIRLLPGDAPSLFLWILQDRLSTDPGFRDQEGRLVGADLVRKFVSILGVSRDGLSQEEMTEVIAPGDALGNIAALQQLLRPYLMHRGPSIDFYHAQLREAVERAYLDEDQEQIEAHAALARYFLAKADPGNNHSWEGDSSHALSELVHHQIGARLWEQVRGSLSDLGFIKAKCAVGMTYDLVHDYANALDALPELQEEKETRQAYSQRTRKYVNDLALFSKRQIPTLEVLPSLEPSAAERADSEARKIIDDPQPVDQLRAFSRFVGSESHALVRFSREPGFCVQQAYNSARSGPVATAAQSTLESRKFENVLLLHQPQRRPSYNPHPALTRTLSGHTASINSLCMSADGKLAASGSDDQALRVWDLESGACLTVLEGHRGSVNGVGITADARRAICWDDDQAIRVWDVGREACLQVLRVNEGGIAALCMTPDGERAFSIVRGLVSSGNKSIRSTLKTWDIGSGACLQSISLGVSSTMGPASLSITPDGRYAALATSETTIRVLDLESGQFTATLRGHSQPVMRVCITPDGRQVSSMGMDTTIRSWRIADETCLNTVDTAIRPYAMDTTTDGALAITVDTLFNVNVWDLRKGCHLKHLDTPWRGPWDVKRARGTAAISADGAIAVSAGEDYAVRAWDVRDGAVAHSTDERNSGAVQALFVSPDRKTVVSVGSQDVWGWDLETGVGAKQIQQFAMGVHPLRLSDDTVEMYLWDIQQAGEVQTIAWHTGYFKAFIIPQACLTPDGRRAITFDTIYHGERKNLEFLVRVWDIATGTCLRRLPGHQAETHFRMTPDGRLLTTCSSELLQVWDLETEKRLAAIPSVKDLHISPDGTTIAVLGYEGPQVLRIGHPFWGGPLSGPQLDRIQTLATLPDAQTIVGGSDDGWILIWSLDRLRGPCTLERTFQAHAGRIERIIPGTDGKKVISVGADRAIRLWDVRSTECLASYQTENVITCVSEMLPGGQLIYGNHKGEVIPLIPRNLDLAPPLVTPVRLWRYGMNHKRGHWDQDMKVLCPWCGRTFIVPVTILDTIRGCSKDSKSRAASALLSECPYCRQPVKYTPFVVDNSARR